MQVDNVDRVINEVLDNLSKEYYDCHSDINLKMNKLRPML